MNQLQEQFYQVMTRLKANQSRAGASSPEPEPEPIHDVRISEMVNGAIISRPVKKLVNIDIEANQEEEKEPIVIDLQQKSKAASAAVTVTRNVNKAKVIADFLNGKHY